LTQIYGITVPADAVAVDALGPDLIGVVLDEGLPTWDSVDETTALEIAASISRARLVALSLSTDPGRILLTARTMRPAVLHLARAHLLDAAALERIRAGAGAELMLTVPVTAWEDTSVATRLAEWADYLLLDSMQPESGVVGATGLVHDWDISAAIVDASPVPVFLAGGLGPDNVTEAIRRVRPAGVDSETRTSRPDDRRRKDLGKVAEFIQAARGAG
jgi:phosphoribosylanthranilate isomerase